jgi:hypothetical protein
MIDFSPDPAQNTQAKLDEQRWLIEFALDEMGEIVEVSDIVAFKLEPAAVFPRRSRIASMS